MSNERLDHHKTSWTSIRSAGYSPPAEEFQTGTVIRVINRSGANAPQGGVLSIEDFDPPYDLSAIGAPHAVYASPQCEGYAVSADTRKVVILKEPIAADEGGFAFIAGCFLAKVTVPTGTTDPSSFTDCGFVVGAQYLDSVATGFKILWAWDVVIELGVTYAWAFVDSAGGGSPFDALFWAPVNASGVGYGCFWTVFGDPIYAKTLDFWNEWVKNLIVELTGDVTVAQVYNGYFGTMCYQGSALVATGIRPSGTSPYGSVWVGSLLSPSVTEFPFTTGPLAVKPSDFYYFTHIHPFIFSDGIKRVVFGIRRIDYNGPFDIYIYKLDSGIWVQEFTSTNSGRPFSTSTFFSPGISPSEIKGYWRQDTAEGVIFQLPYSDSTASLVPMYTGMLFNGTVWSIIQGPPSYLFAGGYYKSWNWTQLMISKGTVWAFGRITRSFTPPSTYVYEDGFFRWDGGSTWTNIAITPPADISGLPRLQQMAICYIPDGRVIVLTEWDTTAGKIIKVPYVLDGSAIPAKQEGPEGELRFQSNVAGYLHMLQTVGCSAAGWEDGKFGELCLVCRNNDSQLIGSTYRILPAEYYLILCGRTGGGSITGSLFAKAGTPQPAGSTNLIVTLANPGGAIDLKVRNLLRIDMGGGDYRYYSVASAVTNAVAGADITISLKSPLWDALAGGEEVTVIAGDGWAQTLDYKLDRNKNKAISPPAIVANYVTAVF